MPLIKSSSKKAFKKNFATELASLRNKGKSKKGAINQALAIAYATKRKSAKK